MCFSSWKKALHLHRTAISPFIGVFSSFQSPVSLYQSSHYMSLSPNEQAMLGCWKKVNVGKALMVPSERCPFSIYSF